MGLQEYSLGNKAKYMQQPKRVKWSRSKFEDKFYSEGRSLVPMRML